MVFNVYLIEFCIGMLVMDAWQYANNLIDLLWVPMRIFLSEINTMPMVLPLLERLHVKHCLTQYYWSLKLQTVPRYLNSKYHVRTSVKHYVSVIFSLFFIFGWILYCLFDNLYSWKCWQTLQGKSIVASIFVELEI